MSRQYTGKIPVGHYSDLRLNAARSEVEERSKLTQIAHVNEYMFS